MIMENQQSITLASLISMAKDLGYTVRNDSEYEQFRVYPTGSCPNDSDGLTAYFDYHACDKASRQEAYQMILSYVSIHNGQMDASICPSDALEPNVPTNYPEPLTANQFIDTTRRIPTGSFPTGTPCTVRIGSMTLPVIDLRYDGNELAIVVDQTSLPSGLGQFLQVESLKDKVKELRKTVTITDELVQLVENAQAMESIEDTDAVVKYISDAFM